MLIDSPRLTAADRAVWARLEHWDDALARDPGLARRADRARQVIEEFATAGPCTAQVSWGKDSVIIASLVATSTAAARIPLVFARARHWETPEVDAVRDAFLRQHPHVAYEERVYEFRVPMRGEPGHDHPDCPTQDALRETLGDGRRITGLRAEESDQRALSRAVHGLATDRSCRPIIDWKAHRDVFPFLYAHDLPVHPAYAMSRGGHHDRRRIRVHALGCRVVGDPTVLAGWEDAYYRDVLDTARIARAGMWQASHA